MITAQLHSGSGSYQMSAVITILGDDIAICIGGGEKEHIGGAALASSRPSLKNDGAISASASVLCVMGHKDDCLARETALQLASKFNTNVLVSVGLHLDQAEAHDIQKLQTNFIAITSAIESWLTIEIGSA